METFEALQHGGPRLSIAPVALAICGSFMKTVIVPTDTENFSREEDIIVSKTDRVAFFRLDSGTEGGHAAASATA